MTRSMTYPEAKRAQITVERHEDNLEVVGITVAKGNAHLVVRDRNLGNVFHYVPDWLREKAKPKCEMGEWQDTKEGRVLVRCERMATRYGGYRGADEWAGKVCIVHAQELAWSELLS